MVLEIDEWFKKINFLDEYYATLQDTSAFQ